MTKNWLVTSKECAFVDLVGKWFFPSEFGNDLVRVRAVEPAKRCSRTRRRSAERSRPKEFRSGTCAPTSLMASFLPVWRSSGPLLLPEIELSSLVMEILKLDIAT